MIHSKSLIRRLAYVPWLLAFGLVLGWAGEAQAAITLTLDKKSIREEEGAVKIKVTAKTDAAIDVATNVILDWTEAATGSDATTAPTGAATQTQFGSRIGTAGADGTATDGEFDRYLITLPTLEFPKETKADATVEGMITFTPHDDDIVGNGATAIGTPPTATGADADNIRIWITGITGLDPGALAVSAAFFDLIDNDQMSTMITLSYGEAKIAQDADPTDVTVTATLDGKVLDKSLEFTLLFDDGNPPATERAVRDQDYRATGRKITIAKGSAKGTAKVEITPLNVGHGNIQMTTTDVTPAADPPDGVQVYGIIDYVLPDDDATASTTENTAALEETTTALVVDFNRDGDYTGTSPIGSVKIGETFNRRIELTVDSAENVITLDPTKKAATKGITPSMPNVREDAGQVEIELEVTLQNKLKEDQRVSFTIDTPDDNPARRDIDYRAEFSALTIPAGEEKGTATLTLTVVDNEDRNPNKIFEVVATVTGAPSTRGEITIVDNETPTKYITLTVNEEGKEVTAGTTEEITVTGTIDGMRFEEDVTVVLVLAPKSDDATAQRDIDFGAVLRSLTIPAGSIDGSTMIEIEALKGGDKTVVVKELKSPVKNSDGADVMVKTVKITLKDAPKDETAEDPGALAFEADIGATLFEFVAGMERKEPVQLPDVKGGAEGDKTYSISALPAGLKFDAAKRTISGVATEATEEAVTVIYTVLDGDGDSVATRVMIMVHAEPPPTISVASVSVTQSSIREDSEETAVITITAELGGDEGAPVDGVVKFTIGAPTDGPMALRDVHYTAVVLGNVSVMKGATQATSTISITPIDNNMPDRNKAIGIHATGTDDKAKVADVTIADDETASTAISLSASPSTISEDADTTPVTVTASLNGKERDSDTAVTVEIDLANSQATRDADYSVTYNPSLTIAAGAISGEITLQLDPIADDVDEDSESIVLIGKVDGLEDGTGQIRIEDAASEEDDGTPTALAFAEGAMISAIEATAGTAIEDAILPEASGGSGDIVYSISDLPDGLAFDAETRTLSGTPTTAAEAVEITYTATDGEEATVTLTFSITINPPLDFSDLGALFGTSDGAGKANPASEHNETLATFLAFLRQVQDEGFPLEVNQPVPAVGPQLVAGVQLVAAELNRGTPPYRVEISALPAGVSFDSETGTLSGTPSLVGSVASSIVVVDRNGSMDTVIEFEFKVAPPPLGAPGTPIPQDYPDDNGGFLLLSWDLSAHHDELNGYRIFREVEAADGEFIPWAMVDAVPEAEKGYAIVATLDNKESYWEIAAERGRQAVRSGPVMGKAVFVSAENLNQPYELMAETLMASKGGAQVGDVPFATLLPEAIAYAQGVAPNLKNVEGLVQTSARARSEERVRSIDNIAPLAVPLLSASDALDDEGGRIGLTWALSPSDRVLQGVVAEAIGPASIGPVVGVYGYSIYRRAAGEDDFAPLAQVGAGVASYVDEMALNGVRYTYQVRPYDQDNETEATVEQTALAVRNIAFDSEGRPILGLFGSDNRVGFDDFFILADLFGLNAESAGFDPAFDLAPNGMIDFDDFFVFADNFNRSTAAAGKRVPMLAGLNADARLYLDARTALPNVGEDFVLDVRLADFAAIKGYGLQVQYEADKLEFVEVQTDQPLGGSELATPQVLSNEAGVLAVAALGDVVSEGEVALSLVFRPTTEIEHTVIELTDNQTYDSAFGFNRLGLPAPVQVQTRPEVFALANNYPNPFNPTTTIKYALPQAADVELTVYNVLGQPVRTLVAEHQSAGRYVVEWDATNDSGHSLSSGMYFYRLEAGGEFLEFKKMLLLK